MPCCFVEHAVTRLLVDNGYLVVSRLPVTGFEVPPEPAPLVRAARSPRPRPAAAQCECYQAVPPASPHRRLAICPVTWDPPGGPWPYDDTTRQYAWQRSPVQLRRVMVSAMQALGWSANLGPAGD